MQLHKESKIHLCKKRTLKVPFVFFCFSSYFAKREINFMVNKMVFQINKEKCNGTAN